MTTIKKKLSRFTEGDTTEAMDRLLEGDLIFRCDFVQIAKHFLAPYFPIPVFSADFKTLRDTYIAETKTERDNARELMKSELDIEIKDNIPEEEPAFYKYICELYLYLAKEPKERLALLYENAIGDVRRIDATLEDIQEKMDEITKNNDANEIQVKKPVLYFYQEHNTKAKEEILRFVLHDIKHYALKESYRQDISGGLWWNVPYNYRWHPDGYTPRMPNDLDNKFRYLTVAEIEALKVQYRDDKPGFYGYLHKFIEREEVLFSIGHLIGQNHILFDRGEIISELLQTYKNGGKIMFSSAAPTIIEGILHELCLLIGEDENDLLQKGFQYKLDKLLPVMGTELYYEYYSFRFRIFRNKVAHGRMTKADVDELADLLLLDFYQVCKMTLSTKFSINQKRFVIDQLSNTSGQPDLRNLIQYLHLSKVPVPSFYGLESQIEKIEKMPASPEFWFFLNEQLDNGGEAEKHGIVQVLQLITQRVPFDTRCTALFKKAGIGKPDKELAMDYLNRLKSPY